MAPAQAPRPLRRATNNFVAHIRAKKSSWELVGIYKIFY